jgi:hypothetical protein
MLGWAQDARAQMTMVVSSSGEGLVWAALKCRNVVWHAMALFEGAAL